MEMYGMVRSPLSGGRLCVRGGRLLPCVSGSAVRLIILCGVFFFFQAEDGIRDWSVTGVQTCALPIYRLPAPLLALDPARRSPARAGAVRRRDRRAVPARADLRCRPRLPRADAARALLPRSEEHTSELQSLTNIVCRLLLEKKKTYQLT